MKRHTRKAFLGAFALLLAALPHLQAHGAGEVHPRLFVTESRIEEIRAAIEVPGSHHREAFLAMKSRVDLQDAQVYGYPRTGDNWNYGRAYLAREAAFLYLLTEERRYAGIAFEALRAVHEDPDPDGRLPEAGYGLSRAAVGMGFAIAYDWAYHGLTREQRSYLREKILLALDAWPSYHHANLETEHQGSNWVAVSRGGELIMMLSVYEEDERPERWAMLKESLRRHLETAYGRSGWSQEGIGYISYAGQFLLPAVFALRSIGDAHLEEAFRRIAFPRLQMAIGSFTSDQYHLMSGVDGGFETDGQGWTSLLLGACAAEEAPFYRSFYDRFMGVDAPLPPAEKYDPWRAGTTWAMIYYPEDVAPVDPDGHVAGTLFDEKKGIYFFRSGWDGPADVLVSVAGDYTHHSHAWDVPEAFQLGLIAGGVPFVGGPGKAATGRDAVTSGFSALLVDGEGYAPAGRNGAPVFSTSAADGGGYVVIDGGGKYEALGLREATRHVLVDFGEAAGEAIISTLDRVRADEAHTYGWQLNVGGARDAGDIEIRSDREGGRPTFLLRGGDAYLKGWVLHPRDATISAEDPLRVSSRGKDADLWIVMKTGRGAAPVAEISGDGLDAAVQVGGVTVLYDGAQNRVVLER